MKSVSVSASELYRESVFRKIRVCLEKCAADETHLALWDSVCFANASGFVSMPWGGRGHRSCRHGRSLRG